MTAPVGIAQIKQVYGDLAIDMGPMGWRIIQPLGWESANCTGAKNLPGLSHPLYIHKVILEPLTEALKKAQSDCPEYLIKTIGCFNPRPKRVVQNPRGVIGWDDGLSLHTAACAVDINDKTNPMGKPARCDMPNAFIRAFTDLGWTHGLAFPTPDPMHFQWASGY